MYLCNVVLLAFLLLNNIIFSEYNCNNTNSKQKEFASTLIAIQITWQLFAKDNTHISNMSKM